MCASEIKLSVSVGFSDVASVAMYLAHLDSFCLLLYFFLLMQRFLGKTVT